MAKYCAPRWARRLWKTNSLQLLRSSDEGYSLVDFELQTTIFSGSKKECYDFVLPYSTAQQRSEIFGLDTLDLANSKSELLEIDLVVLECPCQ